MCRHTTEAWCKTDSIQGIHWPLGRAGREPKSSKYRRPGAPHPVSPPERTDRSHPHTPNHPSTFMPRYTAPQKPCRGTVRRALMSGKWMPRPWRPARHFCGTYELMTGKCKHQTKQQRRMSPPGRFGPGCTAPGTAAGAVNREVAIDAQTRQPPRKKEHGPTKDDLLGRLLAQEAFHIYSQFKVNPTGPQALHRPRKRM
jgi:hypothetical protein